MRPENDPMRHFTPVVGSGWQPDPEQAKQTPPQPKGRVIARCVQIDVRESLDLHTGYSRSGWQEFLWLSGWRARVAILVLKALNLTA